jgi:uncharacterized protein YecT (DUF1311 family)
MKWHSWAFAAAVLCLAIPACAPKASGAQSQAELNEEASRRLASVDQRLNATYEKVIAKVSPAGKEALRKAENSWLQFRDDECAFETAGYRTGSVYPMIYSQCLARLSVERIAHLDRQLNCIEGDLSCGNQ